MFEGKHRISVGEIDKSLFCWIFVIVFPLELRMKVCNLIQILSFLYKQIVEWIMEERRGFEFKKR